MRIETHLTRPKDFDKVYSQGRSWANGPVVMKAVPNGLSFSRYGLSVGRRVGNAVVRNRVKRRLRDILRNKYIVSGYDIVLLAKASAAATSYQSIDNAVASVLARAKMLHTECAADPQAQVDDKTD